MNEWKNEKRVRIRVPKPPKRVPPKNTFKVATEWSKATTHIRKKWRGDGRKTHTYICRRTATRRWEDLQFLCICTIYNVSSLVLKKFHHRQRERRSLTGEWKIFHFFSSSSSSSSVSSSKFKTYIFQVVYIFSINVPVRRAYDFPFSVFLVWCSGDGYMLFMVMFCYVVMRCDSNVRCEVRATTTCCFCLTYAILKCTYDGGSGEDLKIGRRCICFRFSF